MIFVSVECAYLLYKSVTIVSVKCDIVNVTWDYCYLQLFVTVNAAVKCDLCYDKV